eukprot:jgi/Galph1/3128/GphlegSOOS_G1816.1
MPQDPEIVGKNTKLLEYSDRGTGDYRSCSFEIEYPDGTTLSPLVYSTHRIYTGKPAPPFPLPGLFVDSDLEASTLELHMIDPLTKVTVVSFRELNLFGLVIYTVFHEFDVIVRRVLFRNDFNKSLIIRRCYSCTIDFDTDDFYLTHLSGSWARERVSVTESSRGASSHQHNPFGAISVGNPREDEGEVFAFSLVYSGNFRMETELVESGRLRVNMGINPQQFSWDLGPGEEFSTPEVVLCFSDQGLGGISQQHHRLYRNHLMPRQWRNTMCPVLINTWEAMYFNVTHEAVVELAKKAKDCGIEMVVLDDGWFGSRNNTRSGLGDWTANRVKFPFGLEGLCREINELGLHFGIWVEPEMVNVESELYHKHPDWCLHIPRRSRTTGRNQLVLDFSQEAVRTHVIKQVSNILGSCNIEYVKWDMNRHLTEVFSQAFPPERQGEIAHRHILGVYEAFAKITSAFPHVLIESCSGGGGRFDPGMLYYSSQIWCSDNTDALSRVQIQYGTSLVYPVCSMGAHVSSIPNHQTLRSTSMKTRTLVAMCGSFGYEMDVRQLKGEEVEEIRSYIKLRNEWALLILFGTLYRIWSPFSTDSGAWMFVNDEKTEALVIAVNLNRQIGLQLPRMHLRGLQEDWSYLVEELCPGKLRTNVNTGAIETDPRGVRIALKGFILFFLTNLKVFQWSSKTGGIILKLSGRTLMKVGLPVKFMFEGDSLLFSVRAVYKDRYPYYDGEVYDDTGAAPPPQHVERGPNGHRVIIEEPEDYAVPGNRGYDDEDADPDWNPGRERGIQEWSRNPFDRFFESPFSIFDKNGIGELFGNLERSLRNREEEFRTGGGNVKSHVYSILQGDSLGEGGRLEISRHLKDSVTGKEEYSLKREINGKGTEVIRRRDETGQEISQENYYNLTPEEREQFEAQWRSGENRYADNYGADMTHQLPYTADYSLENRDRKEHSHGIRGLFRRLFHHQDK